MRKMSSTLVLSSLAIVVATAYVASPIYAQACLGIAAACPIPAVLPLIALAPDGFGARGDNLIAIPAGSCVNDVPSCGGAPNGFAALCEIFGLVGTPSQIIQNNADTGTSSTFLCNQPIAPAFAPCQAVLIRPTVAAVGAIPAGGPLEGAWLYPTFGDGPGATGDSFFGVPYSLPVGSLPSMLCGALGLPVGSLIVKFDAFTATINVGVCPIAVDTFTIDPGDGLLIRPAGPVGAPVAVGSIC